jgi:hypothetical protein
VTAVVSHPVFARFYARVSPAMDRGGVADHRRRLLSGLSGRVIDVGAGNGLNFAHYPAEVTEVLAVEPGPLLRELAVREGFEIEQLDRFRFPEGPIPTPASSHVRGVAVRRG